MAEDRLQERLQERLRANAARASRAEAVRNQCRARSRVSKADLYRCQKEARHSDRHEDDYGTQWVTEPRFKILVQLGPH